MSVTLACSLVQLLYAVPYSVQLMTRMYDMEKVRVRAGGAQRSHTRALQQFPG